MNKIIRTSAIAAGAAAAFGSANAAVLAVGSIEITLTNPGASQYLQVAEVVATSNGVDVAREGTATATGTSNFIADDHDNSASGAIDGDTGGHGYTGGIYISAFTGQDSNPTLTIDFGGATFDIEDLTLFGRTDDWTFRDDYVVTMRGLDGAVLFQQGGLRANGGSVSADLPASPVPIPGALALFAPALGGLVAARRKRG